jgi:predicted DNA-binding ribbon-helix-helix protein
MKNAASHRYESSLETFAVKVAGRWTTIRLEAELMAALQDVALTEDRDIGDICTQLFHDRRHGSLTSALRLYILRHYRDRAHQRLAPGPSSERLRALAAARHALLATEEHHYVLRQDRDLARVGESDPGIGFLFAYWRALAQGADRPPFAAFELDTLRAVGFDANIHLLDVEAPNPDEFRILRVAPVTMLHRAHDNAPLRSLGDTLYAREIRADYSAAKYGAEPALQHLSVRTTEGTLKYERIILPCAVPGGRVGRLIVGVTPLSRLVPEQTPA